MAGYSLHRNKTIQELLKLHTGFEPKLTNFKPVKNLLSIWLKCSIPVFRISSSNTSRTNDKCNFFSSYIFYSWMDFKEIY